VPDAPVPDAAVPGAPAPDAPVPHVTAESVPAESVPAKCAIDAHVTMSSNPLAESSSRAGESATKNVSLRRKRARAAAFPFAALGLIVLIVLI
jgi:hypothetical protein